MHKMFTIIMPTYNRGYILWKAIESIKLQTYPHWELLIIDDGSTDATPYVVAQFQKDPRIQYVRLPHKGAQHARNYGLELAKGDLITYVDSDDYLYNNFLSTAIEFFAKTPNIVFAATNYNHRIENYNNQYLLEELIEAKTTPLESVAIKDYFHRKVKPRSTGIIHTRQVVDDNIRWDTQLERFHDWDFVLTLGDKYPEGFVYIPLVLFEYCERYGIDGISSNATFSDWSNGFEAIYQKHKNSPLMKGQSWYPHRVEKYTNLHNTDPFQKVSHQASSKHF